MSDDFTRWIPVDPSFVPSEADAARAVEWLRERVPGAEAVTAQVSSEVRFIDCGGNLDAIHCARCGASLSVSWWHDDRGARYNSAMGSMRETLSCIEVALALGYVNEVDPGLLGRIDHVMGTLFKLV